jgi:hypothetical protein
VKKLLAATVVVLGLVIAAPALAAGPTTSGTATISGGVATLTSDYTDASTANDAGALTFPAGMTLSALTTLSADYNLTEGSCGGGSPRFQLNVDGKNVQVYLGPTPNFTGCATGWTSTGNLAANSELRVDLSQYGGAFYSTWAQAVALLGSHTVTGIDFAVDGGWSQTGKKQVVQVENVAINGTTYLVPETGGAGGNVNPAKLCAAQRSKLGAAAFDELWGANVKARNAFGKCVSTIAHARNAGKTQDQILAAIDMCVAKSLKGGALGACVAAEDGVAATLTESQELHALKHAKHSTGRHKGRK